MNTLPDQILRPALCALSIFAFSGTTRADELVPSTGLFNAIDGERERRVWSGVIFRFPRREVSESMGSNLIRRLLHVPCH
jgi:hypothetical protein